MEREPIKKVYLLKTIVQNILLSLGGVMVSLALAEIGARVWEMHLSKGVIGWERVAVKQIVYQPSDNEALGYVLKPKSEYAFEGIHVGINSTGLRDNEFVLEKGNNIYRILSLGDSVTFGWQVKLEETYSKKLEGMLNARDTSRHYEAINAGVPGYNVSEEKAYLMESGLKYQPDLILLSFCVQNDADGTKSVYVGEGRIAPVPVNPQPAFSQPSPLPQNIPLPFKDMLRKKSHLYQLLAQQYGMLRERLRERASERSDEAVKSVRYPFPLDGTDRLWTEVISQLQEIMNVSNQYDIPFLLLVFPTISQVESDDAPQTPQRVLKEFARENHILVVDLLPAFRNNASQQIFADDFSHPSATGHQIAAEEIYKVLLSEGIVPQGN